MMKDVDKLRKLFHEGAEEFITVCQNEIDEFIIVCENEIDEILSEETSEIEQERKMTDLYETWVEKGVRFTQAQKDEKACKDELEKIVFILLEDLKEVCDIYGLDTVNDILVELMKNKKHSILLELMKNKKYKN